MDIDSDLLDNVAKMIGDYHLPSKYDAVEFIPTGSLAMDKAIGGGWARGRNSMISGRPNYGKSSLVLMSCIRAKQDGRIVCVIDTEGNWELGYAERSGMGRPIEYDYSENGSGVGKGKLRKRGDYFYFSVNNESVGTIIRTMARAGVDLIAVDGAATIYPSAELEDESFANSAFATRARLLTKIVNLTKNDVLLNNTVLLWTNQVRDKMDWEENRPGGKALQHAQAVAIDLYSPEMAFTEKSGSGKANLRPESMVIVGRTYKNKVAANYEQFKVNIQNSPRLLVNRSMEIAEVGASIGVIKKPDGSPINGNCWYAFDGKQLAVGKDATAYYLMENIDVALEIEKQIRAAIEYERQTKE